MQGSPVFQEETTKGQESLLSSLQVLLEVPQATTYPIQITVDQCPCPVQRQSLQQQTRAYDPTVIQSPNDYEPGDGPKRMRGRPFRFVRSWCESTTDAWVQSPEDTPWNSSRKPQNSFWQVHKHSLKLQVIQHLLDINAIGKSGARAYSVFFLVPKKNGDTCAILALKWLNHFLARKWFKMETWRTIMVVLEAGDFLASVDLSEAYLHMPVLPRHWNFLHFCYGTWRQS